MDELLCSLCVEGWKAYMDFYEAQLEEVVSNPVSHLRRASLTPQHRRPS